LSLSGEAVVWETETWQAQKRMWFPNAAQIALSDDQKYLLIGQQDGVILLCDLAAGKIVARIRDHLLGLTQLLFAEGGQYFVSSSEDMTARVWDVREVLANRNVAVDEPLPGVTTNSLGMSLAYIPSGEFLMGTSPEYRPYHERTTADTEKMKLRHPVKISKPFFMSQFEVTVGQFREFVEATNYKTTAETTGKGRFYPIPHRNQVYSAEYTWAHPGFEQTDRHPVTQVSWNDARAFCQWLSDKEHKTYRLPTEAEWEYACRAGVQGPFSYTPDYYKNHTRYSNCCDASQLEVYNFSPSADINSNDTFPFTAPVGSFLPNAFGLFDMHGNVQEFCLDFYDPDYYQSSPAIDPPGPAEDPEKSPQNTPRHVVRGGSFHIHYEYSRSAMRSWVREDAGLESYGFRPVLEPGVIAVTTPQEP
jgi:formylglycine-generating enzyme required for sulfatase activity